MCWWELVCARLTYRAVCNVLVGVGSGACVNMWYLASVVVCCVNWWIMSLTANWISFVITLSVVRMGATCGVGVTCGVRIPPCGYAYVHLNLARCSSRVACLTYARL